MIAHFGHKVSKRDRPLEQAALLAKQRARVADALRQHMSADDAEMLEAGWFIKSASWGKVLRPGQRNMYSKLALAPLSHVLCGTFRVRRRRGHLARALWIKDTRAPEVASDAEARLAAWYDTAKECAQHVESLVADLDGQGVDCPRCASKGVKGTGRNTNQVQLRSSDEGATYFYECAACKHEWRVN